MAWTAPTTVWATAASPFNTNTGIVRLDLLDDDNSVTNTREVTVGDLIKSKDASAADQTLFVPGGVLLGRRTVAQQPQQFSSRVLSRNHLQLVVDKVGRIWAIDLGSLHGSKVQTPSGELVQLARRVPRQLLDGEVLTLGKSVESKTDHRPLRIRIGLRFKTSIVMALVGRDAFAGKTDVPGIAEALGLDPLKPCPANHIRGYGLSRSALYDSDYEEPLPRGREAEHSDEGNDSEPEVICLSSRSDTEVVFLSRSSPPPVNNTREMPSSTRFKAPMDVLKELLKETGHLEDPIVAASAPASVPASVEHTPVPASVEHTPPPVDAEPEPALVPLSMPNEEQSDADNSDQESDHSEQPCFMNKPVWGRSLSNKGSEGFVTPVYPSSPNYLDSDEEYDCGHVGHSDRSDDDQYGDYSDDDHSDHSGRGTPFDEYAEYYNDDQFDGSDFGKGESDAGMGDSDDESEAHGDDGSDHEVIDDSDNHSEVGPSDESDNESTRAVVSETPNEIDWRSQNIFSFTDSSLSQPLATEPINHSGAFPSATSFNPMPPSPPLSQSAEEDSRPPAVIAHPAIGLVTPPRAMKDVTNATSPCGVRSSRKRRLEEVDEPLNIMADAGTNPAPMATAVDAPRPSKLRRCAEHAAVALGYMTVGGLLTIAGLCQMAD